MQILIYVILFIAFLIPLTILLAIFLKSISFLVKSFRTFKNTFILEKTLKDDNSEDVPNENKEMETI